MADPGPLLGRGRAADVFDLGGGRVLRRYRTPHPGAAEREALVMTHLRTHGAPVPEVFDASGDDLVMARATGTPMLTLLERRPWTARSMGVRLGAIHAGLLAIPAPDGATLPRVADGDRVLHLDFHPGNVIVDGADAVVIDWTNAALGPAGLDLATSWMLAGTGSVDGVPRPLRPLVGALRSRLLAGYFAVADRAAATDWVEHACRRRLADPATRPEETARVRAFAARHGTGRAKMGTWPAP